MDSRARRRKPGRRIAVAVLALIAAGNAGARVLEIGIERATLAIGRLDRIEAQVEWPDGAERGELRLRAAALDVPELGYRFLQLQWTCPLLRRGDSGLSCEGPLRAKDAGSATLSASWTTEGLALSLARAKGRLALALPRAADAPLQLSAERLPLDWLQPLLAARWADARLTAGSLEAKLELGSAASGGSELAGPVAFAGLGLDTTDGRIAAADLDAEGRLRLALAPASTGVEVELDLHGGELLAGALYASLPESRVGFALDVRGDETGWRLARLGWNDPGVLELSGQGALDHDGGLAALDLEVASGSLARANPRYLEALLGTLGLAGLALDGEVHGQVAIRDAAPSAIDLGLARLDARAGDGRFEVAGLDGRLRWNAGADPVDSELSWSAAAIGVIELGPARLPLRSVQRRLALRAPVGFALLGGRLQLPRFAWRPGADAGQGTRLDLALELDDLDLAQLCRALDWPAFSGKLSGRIPGVRYADEVLHFDGGLDVEVFDGKVGIAALTFERPFGVAPTLAGDVEFDDLDLRPLTGAFGFGEITGRLDGHIRGLRLVDWAPVAFDAAFRTDPDAKGDRRISQRAVNDLTRVGGGGIGAGLQNQVLKLFDTFGYRRIGLSCRLSNNVCTMGGVDSSGTGYTIVEGSGLPRVSVIGHQRRVDWPVLVARLKSATEGQVPIVE